MKYYFVLLFICGLNVFSAQTIRGYLPQAKNTAITLKSYYGFTEKEIAQTKTDSLGFFFISNPRGYSTY